MAIIHGTNAAEKFLPGFTSPGVTGGRPTIDADTIFAAGGNDVVRGGLGVDNAFLGGGDDRYIWNIGDGNDVVGGGVGIDTLDIRGSGAQTLFELFSDGLGSARMTRDFFVEFVTLGRIERVVFHPLGGRDQVTVGMLGQTPVKEVVIDLAGTLNGKTGDGAHDAVEIDGDNAGSQLTLKQTAAGVQVLGIGAKMVIQHADTGLNGDRLTIKGFGGNDRIDASGVTAKALALEFGGGEGNDTLIGGVGRDTLSGGNQNDILLGGKGGDFLDGGAGFDKMIGGKGADRFNFSDGLVDNVDTVTDFQVGIDKIGLKAGIFTLTGNTVSADQFHIGATAADANDHIIYNADTGALYYDADGLGGSDAVQFAKLAKHLALTHADFEVLV